MPDEQRRYDVYDSLIPPKRTSDAIRHVQRRRGMRDGERHERRWKVASWR